MKETPAEKYGKEAESLCAIWVVNPDAHSYRIEDHHYLKDKSIHLTELFPMATTSKNSIQPACSVRQNSFEIPTKGGGNAGAK